MVEEFAEDLPENKQPQKDLFAALNKKKPFRHFYHAINNSRAYRQQWFDYLNKWQQNHVREQINVYNEILKFNAEYQ